MMGEADCLILLFIDFYVLVLTLSPRWSFQRTYHSLHSTNKQVSSTKRARLTWNVSGAGGGGYSWTSCIMLGIGWNLVALLLAYL
jgi:hypothetical protein